MAYRRNRRYYPSPSNSDDIIDSRDVIARIEELQGERIALDDAISDAEEELVEEKRHYGATLADPNTDRDGAERADIDVADAEKALKDARASLQEWDDENGAELKALEALQEECEGYSDWLHGATLIRDTYFETYARELADDLGDVPKDLHWPFTHIDWAAAASELMQDYTSVDFAGEGYQIR